MLKQLFDIWREDQDPLNEMTDQLKEMLQGGHEMFRSVTDALFLGGDMGQLKEETYQRDHRLNDLEQNIRRQVVVHLSLGHVDDLTPSLILMSVVKDAERIGDYAKNIFQVARTLAPLDKGAYLGDLKKMRNEIIGYFDKIIESFVDSQVEQAEELLKEFYRQERDIDRKVTDLLVHQDKENAVAFALLFRFFKRIISHLGNIATSTVMPIDKLDYFDEDGRNPQQELE